MNKNRPVILYLTIFLCMALFFSINTGCRQGVTVIRRENAPLLNNIKKIALIGFRPSSYPGDLSDETQSHVLEGAHLTESLILEKSDYMTSMLFEMMLGHKEYEIINPDRVENALSKIISSGQGATDIEISVKAALELKADAVVIGYLFKWKERVGSDYAVSDPASVGFDLYLVDPENGALLWKGRFNKTQRSLSENLLDIRTFIKGKGKWMTAGNLARVGLNELVDDLFLFMGVED